MKSRFLLLSLTMFTALTCLGWGQKGHDVTAYIAENHLTPATKAKVEAALDGKSMVYYSNWLDNASNTPEYAYSKSWHYKNIDADRTYENASVNPKGDVVSALNNQIALLRKGGLSKEQEQLALKIIIHLVGDVHQPMHMGHLSDLGGNLWPVKFFNKDTKLHSIWDTDLVESSHKWSYTEWENQIDRLSSKEQKSIIKGDPNDWAKETFKIATKIYETTPQGSKLSYSYIAEAAPIIETQFLRGGLRLADLLNSIYDPNYKK